MDLATDNLFRGFLRDPRGVFCLYCARSLGVFLEADFLAEALVADLAVIGVTSGVAGVIGSALISGFGVIAFLLPSVCWDLGELLLFFFLKKD